jgi:hypothetical protein
MPSSIEREIYQSVSNELPNIEALKRQIGLLSPEFISVKFKSDSNFPIAAVCFQDASRTLSESRYALVEALAHKVWYLEKVNPKDEYNAIFFTRFYSDDVALRLYSAAEHLAKAVVFMLDIQDEKLQQTRTGSRFTSVRKILLETYSDHIITKNIDELYRSREWKTTIKYRDTWVHNQPPIIDGTGMVFERKRRWSVSGKVSKMGLGAGDEPKYAIDDLLSFVKPALFQYTEKLACIVEFYVSELEKKGITITENGMQVSILKSKAG